MIKGMVKNTVIDANNTVKVTVEYTLTNGEKLVGELNYKASEVTDVLVSEDIKKKCEALMIEEYNLSKLETLKTVSYECNSVEIEVKSEVIDDLGEVISPKEVITIGGDLKVVEGVKI